MTIALSPELEAAISVAAQKQGLEPESLVEKALRERFIPPSLLNYEPRDEWERGILAMGIDCGVSLSDAALSREEMYD